MASSQGLPAANSPDWKGWFSKLDAWKAAFPDSLTQPVARAEALVNYAWEARGGGYANTVTGEGWKLLAERLGQARGVLEDAAKLPVRDPHWYNVMQSVALGEGWDRDRSEALFAEAVAAEPTYYHYYFSRTSAELPRWAPIRTPGSTSPRRPPARTTPTRASLFIRGSSGPTKGRWEAAFKTRGSTGKKSGQGFRDIEKRYPNSNWNLNNFCRFACLAGDRETAHELFDRLGDAVSIPTWGNRTGFEGWRRWAEPSQNSIQLRADLAISTDERLMAQSVAFSPDGKTLLAGYDDGKVRLWDLAKRKLVWSDGLGSGPVAAVAFSPDGQVFAAGTGDQSEYDTPGRVALWDAATRQTVATVERPPRQRLRLGVCPRRQDACHRGWKSRRHRRQESARGSGALRCPHEDPNPAAVGRRGLPLAGRGHQPRRAIPCHPQRAFDELLDA